MKEGRSSPAAEFASGRTRTLEACPTSGGSRVMPSAE